jgi:ribonuclease BN (tRNA processing enzyme)
MAAKLAFLGTGTCVSTPSNSAALAISDGKAMTLVDCGGGCYHQISRVGDDYFSHEMISSVLLTHFHADHASGLIDLLWGEMWDPVSPRSAPLTLAGPPGLSRFIRECVLPFIGEHRLPFEIYYIELEHGDSFNGPFFTARSHRLSHTNSSTGYCIEVAGSMIAVTGDTGFCENLLTLLSSSNLAIMEWSISGLTTVPHHLSDSDFNRLVKSGVMPPRVFITHMYPQPDITYNQQVARKKIILGADAEKFFFPRDLDIIAIG